MFFLLCFLSETMFPVPVLSIYLYTMLNCQSFIQASLCICLSTFMRLPFIVSLFIAENRRRKSPTIWAATFGNKLVAIPKVHLNLVQVVKIIPIPAGSGFPGMVEVRDCLVSLHSIFQTIKVSSITAFSMALVWCIELEFLCCECDRSLDADRRLEGFLGRLQRSLRALGQALGVVLRLKSFLGCDSWMISIDIY